MKYILDTKKFRKRLAELGFPNLAGFAASNRIHRNTLHDLLKGKSIFSASFEKISSKLKADPLELIRPMSEPLPPVPFIEEIRPIVARLSKMDKRSAVVLIGSRAGKKAKPYSDWDLGVLRHPEPLSGMEYLRMKRVVGEETEDLVRQVDLVNLNQAPAWFLEGLKGEILFLEGNRDAFYYLEGVLDGIQKEKIA